MDHSEVPAEPHKPASPLSLPAGAASEISSRQLLGEQGQVRIAHKGAVYTLRATSKGGLILTK